MEIYTAEQQDTGKRLDVYLSEMLYDQSRSAVQRLIEKNMATVNDLPVNKNYKLKDGDRVSVSIPQPEAIDIQPENIPLDILYEDRELIVVNKPQGMVVHPAPGHYSGTLVNALMYHCGGELSGINGELRPGIVHRIDKDTSGVLVAAKSENAHKRLAEQLAAHSMKRLYNAIVFNGFKEDEGTVDKMLARSKQDRKKIAVVPSGGRNAVTHYRVLQRIGRFTLLELRLETGRTHQIRVHMSYIGHPLLGDEVYGSAKQPYNTAGQALHARVLGFVHPVSGEYMEFETKLPDYFENLILRLGGNTDNV